MGGKAQIAEANMDVLSLCTAHSTHHTTSHQQQTIPFAVSAYLKELVPNALALESFVHIKVQDAVWLNLNVQATLLDKKTLASHLQASKDKDPAKKSYSPPSSHMLTGQEEGPRLSLRPCAHRFVPGSRCAARYRL